jgi:hypothetical protein
LVSHAELGCRKRSLARRPGLVASPLASVIMTMETAVFRNAVRDFAHRLVSGRLREDQGVSPVLEPMTQPSQDVAGECQGVLWLSCQTSCQESQPAHLAYESVKMVRRSDIVHPDLDLNQNSPQRALKGVDGPAYGVTAEVPINHAMLATVVEVGLDRDPQILHQLLASLL